MSYPSITKIIEHCGVEAQTFTLGLWFVRAFEGLDVGTVIGDHKHNKRHNTMLLSGKAKVTVEGDETVLTGFGVVDVGAGLEHSIEILEAGTKVWCVFNHVDVDGNIVDHPTQNFEGYR